MKPEATTTSSRVCHKFGKNNFTRQYLKVMHLAGKVIFVAGATGEVGRGAVHALVDAGAKVYCGGRNHAKLDELKAEVSRPENVFCIVADYSTVQGGEELAKAVEGMVFDSVIASSGPWWPFNDLSTVPDLDVFGKALRSNVEAHMLLYRIIAPKTKEHYIIINGAALKGLPHSGLTGITALAVSGFANVAHLECSKSKDLPDFTHCLLSSSVGHAKFRSETHKPEEYGRAFVAMAMGKHESDETGTVLLDDAMYEKLVRTL